MQTSVTFYAYQLDAPSRVCHYSVFRKFLGTLKLPAPLTTNPSRILAAARRIFRVRDLSLSTKPLPRHAYEPESHDISGIRYVPYPMAPDGVPFD